MNQLRISIYFLLLVSACYAKSPRSALARTSSWEDGASASQTTVSPSADSDRLNAGVNLFVQSKSGLWGWGYSVGYQHRINQDSPLSLGLSTGYVTGTNVGDTITGIVGEIFGEPAFTRMSVQMLPVLPTIMVRQYSGSFHPYAAASIGPTFAFIETTRGNDTKNTTQTFFTGMVRGGIDIDILHPVSLNIEPLSLGYSLKKFTWNPQLSLAVSF